MNVTNMKIRAMYVWAIALCISISCVQSVAAQQGGTAERIADVLRIHVGGKRILGEADLMHMKFANESAGMAEFKRNIVPIQRQASVQLVVQVVGRNGQVIDVTKDDKTTYQSLAPSYLSVSSEGVVTAAPTPGAPLMVGGDLAILVNYEGENQSAWNKVFMTVIP